MSPRTIAPDDEPPDDEENPSESEKSRPRRRGNPHGRNPDDLFGVRKQQDELFRSITKPLLNAFGVNLVGDALRDYQRHQYAELQNIIPKIDPSVFTRRYFDDLRASALQQRDVTHRLAQQAEDEDISPEVREVLQASEQQTEATLEEVEQLSRDLEFGEDGSLQDPSEEKLERVRSTTEKIVVAEDDLLDLFRSVFGSLEARRDEAREQSRETLAQHQASQRIAVLASVVAILALVGGVPQGIAAIPDVARMLPGWGLPWWGTTLCVLTGTLLTWGLIAAWNSRHEDDEDRGRILTALVKASSWLSGGVTWFLRKVRLLPREKQSQAS